MKKRYFKLEALTIIWVNKSRSYFLNNETLLLYGWWIIACYKWLAKTLTVKLLGNLKIYVFNRKFWLISWKFHFFLISKGSISKVNTFWLNQKTLTQKSIGSWIWAATHSPFYSEPSKRKALSKTRTGNIHWSVLRFSVNSFCNTDYCRKEGVAGDRETLLMTHDNWRRTSFLVKANSGKKLSRSRNRTIF